MKYVLLLAIHWGYGTAMVAPEFSDLLTCQQARTEWVKAWGETYLVAICVPKGEVR